MTLRFASQSSVFVPEATGQVVAFVRKESEFPLNRYCTYIPSPATVGLYAKLGRDHFARIVSDAENAWHDGAERPVQNYNQVAFEMVEFATQRRSYSWTLGHDTVNQAKLFKIKLAHMDGAISQAMTNRTNRVVSMLETTSNWGTHYETANTLNGGAGTWDAASDDPDNANYLAIAKSLYEAARRINLATNGKVKIGDLRLIVSPGLAIAMSQSGEISNYVRETPQAHKVIREGLDPDVNNLWGMPASYRGFEIVVEDTPIVSERHNSSGTEATTNRTYVKADNSAVLVTRQGGLDGEYGTRSYSTVQLYHYQELLRVEARDDAWNRRVEGAVSENIKELIAASPTGFLITNTL